MIPGRMRNAPFQDVFYSAGYDSGAYAIRPYPFSVGRTLPSAGNGDADVDADLRGVEAGRGAALVDGGFVAEEHSRRNAVADGIPGAGFDGNLGAAVECLPVGTIEVQDVEGGA